MEGIQKSLGLGSESSPPEKDKPLTAFLLECFPDALKPKLPAQPLPTALPIAPSTFTLAPKPWVPTVSQNPVATPLQPLHPHTTVRPTKFICRFVCAECKATYETLQQFREHIALTGHRNTTTSTSVVNPSNIMPRQPIIVTPTKPLNFQPNPSEKLKFVCRYACSECKATFETLQEYRRHVNEHASGKRHLCNVCGAGFTNVTELETHKATHTGAEFYKCNECGIQFKFFSTLELHKKVHSGEIHKCEVCGKTFNQKEYLDLHSQTHNNLHLYKCKMCEKAFPNTANLVDHITSAHPGARLPYGLEMLAPNKLLSKHTGVSSLYNKQFKCHVCGKVFLVKANFIDHVTDKHPGAKLPDNDRQVPRDKFTKSDQLFSDSKLYKKCEVVIEKKVKVSKLDQSHNNRKEEFKDSKVTLKRVVGSKTVSATQPTSSSYSLHRNSVKNEPEVICLETPTKTTRNANHIERRTHPDVVETAERQQLGKQTDKEPSNKRRHLCNICGEDFSTVTDLREHNFKHTSEKSCKCKVCGATFKSADKLKSHIVVHARGKPYGLRTKKAEEDLPSRATLNDSPGKGRANTNCVAKKRRRR